MDGQDAKGKANPRVNSPDRSQVDPHPKMIDDLIPPDHPARVIWELVRELDLAPLFDEIRAVEEHPGRPATDPRILVGLWLYATEEGIGSARELARRCRDCDPFKWLCGGVEVSYHTLSNFRIAHPDWLKNQVVTHIAAMRAEGLVDLTNLGQDGMRVRANAGSDTFRRLETLDRLLDEAEQQWDQLQTTFHQETQLSAGEQEAQARAAREKIERLKQAREEVQQLAEQREERKKGDGATARVSTTDPEARVMKMGDGGFRPAYNVELCTNLDSLVIVGADVNNCGSDAGQMEPMVQQVESEQEPLPPKAEYHVDGGFVSKEDIDSVSDRGVVVYAPVKDEAKQKEAGQDPYAAKRGDSPQVAAWRARMGTAEGKEKYKRRSKTEWPNAGCRNRGLHQFLVRGLAKVRSVVNWHVWAHNLRRMVVLRAKRAQAVA